MPARKKDGSTRARANKASTSSVLKEAPKGRRPALPRGRDWHPQVVAWWADVWASPMAAEWHQSDRHGLFVLAGLMQDFWTASSATARKEAATEIRLQRQSFGLTPYDRRRLEWTIEKADEARSRGRQRRSEPSKPRKGASDPRQVLSLAVLEGGAS